MNLFKLISFFLYISAGTVIAQQLTTVSPKTYTTFEIDVAAAPSIDGNLADSIWESAEWATNFIEVNPDENTDPSEQTKFKILYDQKHLYIALKALDSEPETITNRLSRRDGFVGDRINVLIDSYHDLRTGFLFTVTAAGVRGDEFITDNGNNIDASWNPIWSAKALIDNEGWTAEMKIPLSQLRFSNDPNQVWGLNVVRNYFKNNELSAWNRIPIGAAGWVSEAGKLKGLKNIKPQKQIEIQPFVVTKLDRYEAEAGNPYADGNDFNLNTGLDAKIGITNDLTLDVTINPDFGQVEADPAAINLDGFEIFNRDQRPFFVENKNIFDYRFADNRNNLFFSRRIGRSPQVNLETTDEAFVNQPQNTTILGAAKFSGKTKNGWSIGVLESMTSKEFTEISTNGNTSESLAEPFTNYLVGRVQKDFNKKNTFFGGMFTATNRFITPEVSELRKSAYSGGIDFTHQWKNRAYFMEANIVMSHVKGSKEAIKLTQENLTHLFNRVDATHLEVDPNRTSLTGTGGRFGIGKVGGQHWNYNAGFKWVSPELELNDIGFLRSADEMIQYANLRYRSIKPTGVFRDFNVRFNQFSAFDFEGNYNRIQYQINGSASFLNNWEIDFGLAHKPRIFSNSILRGGPRWRFSKENFQFFFVGSDRRKNFNGTIGLIHSQAKENNFSLLKFESELNYQPTNAFNISLSPEYSISKNQTQYVTQSDYNSDSRYVLGTIDNHTLTASVRLDYTINPNLSIQYYGQPFISRGRYKDFKYVTNPVAERLTERFQLYDSNQINLSGNDFQVDENRDGTMDYSFSNPDFSYVQFNSNLVLRWEYIPGSELFLVWSQGVKSSVSSSDGLFEGFETGILDERPQNIFLLKATYRFIL
ncbi:MAG: DUF5916 domain-containing protein [Flavobacteriaceae bacterium]|jgi:hypothetical protein